MPFLPPNQQCQSTEAIMVSIVTKIVIKYYKYLVTNKTTTTVLQILCKSLPALAGTPSKKLENFVGVMFYCLHALADGN